MRTIKVLFTGFVFCASAIISSLVLVQPEAAVIFAREQTQSRQLQRQTDSVSTWPSKAKRWALIIGVDQYRDGQINALKGSVNDAHTLADALVRYAGFPQDQVIVLTTDQPEERQPTRINILTYLSNLASLVPKDGLLLLSFAGHGIERGGQAYLIPSDARLSHDVSLLEESAVSVTRMHDRIKAIGVGQVIVLLDACRNDPGGRADAPNNMSSAYTKFNFDVRNREVQAFATFYATAVGYRAYEYTEKRQGYFTWAIVEGLKGGAANDKGEVTLSALVKYVQDNVPKRIAIDLGATEQQKPFATIEGYRADELIVAVVGPKVAINSNQPGTSGVDPTSSEVSFWDSIKNGSDSEDFKDYLNRYPNGQFEGIARRRIQALARNPSGTDTGRERDSSGGLEGTIWENKDESRGLMSAVFIYEFLPSGTYQTHNPNAPNVSGGGTWKQDGNHLVLKEGNLTIEGILSGDRIDAEFYSSGRRTSLTFTRKGSSRRTSEAPGIPLPTVDEILEANVRALGGKTAFEKLTTLSLRGLVEVSAAGKTFNGTTEMYVKFPDKSLSINNVPKLEKSTQGFDGTIGWRRDERRVTLMNDWQIAFRRCPVSS